MSSTSDEYEPGQGRGGGLCTACICVLMGLVLYPLALGTATMNEKEAVCDGKLLYAVENNVKHLSCSSFTAESGEPVQAGDLGFLSCELDKGSMKKWSSMDIPGLEHHSPVFSEPGLGLSVQAEMLVCIEVCACPSNHEIDDLHTCYTEKGPSLLSSPCKHGFEYIVDWRPHLGKPTASFNNPTLAKTKCLGINPTTEGSVKMQIPDKYAKGSSVPVQGLGWHLNEKQSKEFPIDIPVPMSQQSLLGYHVTGDRLYTCPLGAPLLGCMRLSARVSRPNRVALLGEVSETPGMMKEEGWKAPGEGVCSDQTVQLVCPSSGGGKSSLPSCGELETLDDLFEFMHKDPGAWPGRFSTFLLAWLAIACIFRSLSPCMEAYGGFLGSVPGLGRIVDEMTEIFAGEEKEERTKICGFSCLCGCASLALVVAWMLVRMYPMTGDKTGFLLFIPAIGLCAGTGFLMHFFRQKRKKRDGAAARIE